MMMESLTEFGMGPTWEALARFLHGASTVFFVTWSVLLWPQRNQNNIMRLLMANMMFLAFCDLKDIVFLFDGMWENVYLTGISVTVDLLYVPLMCSFFFEVVSPGVFSLKKLIPSMVIQGLFIPVYLFTACDYVYHIALFWAYGTGVVSMVMVFILSIRHTKYIRDNYSYTEYIDVSWLIKGGACMLVCLTIFLLAFTDETYLSDSVYYFISISVWVYLYVLTLRHKVVDTPPLSIFTLPVVAAANQPADATRSDLYEHIRTRLHVLMEQEKAFLNPKLTLQDVARDVGTNRTYLSEFLNNELEVSFYEYVNRWRVKEACIIIEKMTQDKSSVQNVAGLAGFNSVSTFNRSFLKEKGMTPTQYFRNISR